MTYERRRVTSRRKVTGNRVRTTRYERVRVMRTRWVRAKVPGKTLVPFDGVLNRPWTSHQDRICGEQHGAMPCERPVQEKGPGMKTSTVTIADFHYVPGDLSLSGQAGAPVQVKQGTSLRFFNADQAAGIRHSVTTCEWPCNGAYVANYPLADGVWDSDTLGYDPVDGGNPNPVADTPKDMPAGKYSYFCRVHPWMRGAFEVVP